MLNLHPLVVHFPIALFITGFVVDGFGWLLRRGTVKRIGLALVLLGVLSTVPAVLTGLAIEATAEAQLQNRLGAEAVLEAHEELATTTAAVLLGVALVRLALGTEWLWRQRAWGRGLLATYLVVGTLGLGMLALTGYRGGELVYRYGTGVELLSSVPATSSEAEDD